MEITTIKLQKKTKNILDRMKQRHESYDAAIQRLLDAMEQKDLKQHLANGYLAGGHRDIATAKEWETADAPWPK